LPAVFFITHPDVVIDPNIPVSDWPLNEHGRARMRAFARFAWIKVVHSVFASSERKARDGAEILAEGLGLPGYRVVDGLGENDRSATGYLPSEEFEPTVDAFFAHPKPVSVGGKRRAPPRPESFAQSRRFCSKRPAAMTLPFSDMGAPERCSIAISPICRLAGIMINQQRMVETGLYSTGQVEDYCLPGGARSMHDAVRCPREGARLTRASPDDEAAGGH
jgi:hypothetical protein